MGDRKELLKKSLGISEYPWTSDDEMEESQSRMDAPDVSVLRRPNEPRISTGDMPGSSGSQQQATSSAQETAEDLPPTPPAGVAAAAAAAAAAASNRRQAEYERDLFWSIVNNQAAPVRLDPPTPPPASNAATIRTRMQVMFPHGLDHRPASEYFDQDRFDNGRNLQEIRRFLTFKRLTRNVNALRLSGNNYSMRDYNMGAPVPSEATSTIRISRPGRGNFRRYTPLRYVPGQNRFEAVVGPAIEVHNETARRARAHDDTQDVPSSTAQIRVDINIRPPDEVAGQQETPGPSNLPSISEEENSVQGDASEPISSNNASGVTEEEIVEINPSDAAPVAEELEEENSADGDVLRIPQHRDSNLTLAIRDNAERQLVNPSPPKTSQGVKRKRGDSDEYPELYTVKDFNQDLLRLLECPVCLEWMEPPMSQCRRGHLVCGRCRDRLAACPVCRTTFSSVRNRAMEGVAEMLRYPCRHGCGREVRLRRRAPHEASCVYRQYLCPAPACHDTSSFPRDKLGQHFQSQHMQILKIGARHKFSVQLYTERHDNWLMFALNEYFHLRIDVDVRVVVYVTYIGPKCDSKFYNYEVSVEGQNSSRKLVYARSTHSDLESPSLNMNRQDCFHMTTDQAMNFMRFKRHGSDAERYLDFTVEITKNDPQTVVKEESDS